MFYPRVRLSAILGLLVAGVIVGSIAGCGSGGTPAMRIVYGDTQKVNGSSVTAWSRVDSTNTVIEVGATIPRALFLNPPAQAGTGPAGAIAVVAFPSQVQATTYFNHLELHWNPNGHPPAYTMVPHFDLHFYGVTQQQVLQVTGVDPTDPAADHVPTGYVLADASDSVPEMGRHAHNPADYVGTFTTMVNVAGFYNGQMTFLEPTITQAYLAQKVNFTLPVPTPATLGRATRYPTTLTATYIQATDSYTFVYSGFVSAQ